MNADLIIDRLSANAEAIRALLQPVSDAQATWKPDAETWSLVEVMTHFYNEERLDFRKHLREMFADPAQPWGQSAREDWVTVPDLRQGLEAFLSEREASLEWLRGLQAPNWDVSTGTPWGSIRTGDVLYAWVAHDFLHIRQLNELLYAWEEKEAVPYSVEYAGGW